MVRDATWFAGALLHTRHRNRHKTVRPLILVARSAGGIEWDAPDDTTTDVFFVLDLEFDTYHLSWLTQLSRMALVPGFLDRLRAHDTPAALCEEIGQAVPAARRRGVICVPERILAVCPAPTVE